LTEVSVTVGERMGGRKHFIVKTAGTRDQLLECETRTKKWKSRYILKPNHLGTPRDHPKTCVCFSRNQSGIVDLSAGCFLNAELTGTWSTNYQWLSSSGWWL